IGARLPERALDLSAASTLYLRDSQKPADHEPIPADMRAFFELGDAGFDLARKSLEYVIREAKQKGVSGVPLFYPDSQIKLKAPIIPKKFFHTAGNFREHHVEAEKAGFSHPVLPWIVFFQNVDAIIGPDEPVVYPSHLTSEPDYELELAVVIKKSGKHFSEAEACDYIAGDVVSTGTVSGVAAFSGDPKAWYLKPGDVMECEIENIGILRNPVVSWQQAHGKLAEARAVEKVAP